MLIRLAFFLKPRASPAENFLSGSAKQRQGALFEGVIHLKYYLKDYLQTFKMFDDWLDERDVQLKSYT